MKHYFVAALTALLGGLFVVTGIAASAATSTAAESNQSNQSNQSPAIKGYDVVAYFEDAKPVIGTAEFVATHQGQTYQFKSAAHRDKFIGSPQKYAPQYGGFCAFGATRGYKAAIDPTAFTIVDGKLYLNYSAGVQSIWEKDIPGFIKLADQKWPETAKTSKIIR